MWKPHWKILLGSLQETLYGVLHHQGRLLYFRLLPPNLFSTFIVAPLQSSFEQRDFSAVSCERQSKIRVLQTPEAFLDRGNKRHSS